MAIQVHYFFTVQGPSQRYEDEAGVLLPDDKSAVTYAEKFIQELKSDRDFDYRGWFLIVQDGTGRTVHSTPL